MSVPMFANDSRRIGSPNAASFRGSLDRGYDWDRLHAVAIDRNLSVRHTAAAPIPAMRIEKRVFDIFVAAILIAALSPLLVIVSLLLWLEGGSVVFSHRRVGTDGRRFGCLKFRTMCRDADKVLKRLLDTDSAARAEWDRDYKLRDDPRITKVGKVLRATSLDELPQLFNVLRGDMSIVGPRPIVADEIARYGAAYHDYAKCRPGITGIWQISGRNDVGYRQRIRLDRDYARNWSFWTDCQILLRTPMAVLKRSGAY